MPYHGSDQSRIKAFSDGVLSILSKYGSSDIEASDFSVDDEIFYGSVFVYELLKQGVPQNKLMPLLIQDTDIEVSPEVKSLLESVIKQGIEEFNASGKKAYLLLNNG